MTDGPQRRPEDDGTTPREPVAALAELQALLVDGERRDIAELRNTVEGIRVDANSVSPTLYGAVRLHPDPASLGKALVPAVESAIRHSVLRDRQTLSSLLFPIIGPAIRQSVQSALRSMTQSLNQVLDHSLSPQAFRWRLEAIRSGRTFAEIVMLNTLEYRVEEVFLIEQSSGLLLQHVGSESSAGQADVVSAMLTAIRDFVRDSFGAADALGTMELGNLKVWIESGPRALIATVIRGTPPSDLRSTMADALAHVHMTCADELAAGDADTDHYQAIRGDLEACLQASYKRPSTRPSPAVGAVVVLVFIGLGLWIGAEVGEARRWQKYVATLRSTPGILVAGNGEERGRRFIAGLRDPLAVDPVALLAEHGFTAVDVASDWQPYQALQPTFILARARQVLAPPPTAAIELKDGVLRVLGRAEASWIERAGRLASVLPGVVEIDVSLLTVVPVEETMPRLSR